MANTSSKTASALLKVDDLHVSFNTLTGPLFAVNGVSFELHENEVLAVVGESGSGKSVSAYSILGLLPDNGSSDKGSIQYKQMQLSSFTNEKLRSIRGKEISMIFQEPGRSFDPINSIGKALIEAIQAHNPDMPDEEARARSIKLLEEVHVPDAEERMENFPHQFSGGLLQRIMIAIALANNPAVLIADEPTTSLDVTVQKKIVDLMVSLKEKHRLGLLFISHDLALVSTFADRIMVMYSGEVMETGPAREVLTNPFHPYTKGLLNSTPKLGVHYSQNEIQTIQGELPNPFNRPAGCVFAPRCPYKKSECEQSKPQNQQHKGRTYKCILEAGLND